MAASSIGSAALPAGMGIAIGAIDAGALAPMLLALALAMCGLYALLSNLTGPRPRALKEFGSKRTMGRHLRPGRCDFADLALVKPAKPPSQ